MIRFRSFRNYDPPGLAEIWRLQSPLRRLAQPMSAALLEQYVFAKSYFDAHGLIVAADGSRLIGFVQTGFGPTADETALDFQRGVICGAFALPSDDRGMMLVELLGAAEDYLRKQGATYATTGRADGYGPFFLGLAGGARLPGILEVDREQQDLYRGAGYEAQTNGFILQRSLAGFRPPVDRDQLRVRRAYDVAREEDPMPNTWWKSIATTSLERIGIYLVDKTGTRASDSVIAWNMHWLSHGWGLRTAGIEDLAALARVAEPAIATMLLADVLKTLQSLNVAVVEAFVDSLDGWDAKLLTSLGFQVVYESQTLQKSLGPTT